MTSLQEIQGKFNTTDVDKKETFLPFPIKNDAILYIKIPVKPGSLLVFSWDRGGIQERCTLYTKELYWAESLDNYNFPFLATDHFEVSLTMLHRLMTGHSKYGKSTDILLSLKNLFSLEGYCHHCILQLEYLRSGFHLIIPTVHLALYQSIVRSIVW